MDCVWFGTGSGSGHYFAYAGFPGMFKLCVCVCLIYLCFVRIFPWLPWAKCIAIKLSFYLYVLPFKKRNKFHSRLGRSSCYLSNVTLVQYVIECGELGWLFISVSLGQWEQVNAIEIALNPTNAHYLQCLRNYHANFCNLSLITWLKQDGRWFLILYKVCLFEELNFELCRALIFD